MVTGPGVELLSAFGPKRGGRLPGQFHNPEGLASDSRGRILVADETNHRVQRISPDGEPLWSLGAVGADGRPRHGTAPGQFFMFRGIGVDAEDNLFVGDSWNNRVQKFDSGGSFRMMFGSYGNGPGQFGGAGPNGLAFDADGHIYVSDTHTYLGGNNRVQKFDHRGRFVAAFGGHGVGPGRFAGRSPLRGRYGHEIGRGATSPEGPYGLAVGPVSGHLYASDTENNRIQVFDLQGTCLRSIGEGVIFQPRQICLDSRENIYVAGFHCPPDVAGIGPVVPVGPQHRFLWILSKDGDLLATITADDADGLFDHAGGRHHAVAVSRTDEGLVFIQAGHRILKFRVHW